MQIVFILRLAGLRLDLPQNLMYVCFTVNKTCTAFVDGCLQKIAVSSVPVLISLWESNHVWIVCRAPWLGARLITASLGEHGGKLV